MTEKKCKNCGNVFSLKSNNQSYCSPECFKINRKNYMKDWEQKHKQERTIYAKSEPRKKRRKEISNLPENKKKRKVYRKIYKQRPYVKSAARKYGRKPEVRARLNKNNMKKVTDAKTLLGGKCVTCGIQKQLQFHHVKYVKNRKNKSQNHLEALKHPERFVLLCGKCHNVVTFALTDRKRVNLVLSNIRKVL